MKNIFVKGAILSMSILGIAAAFPSFAQNYNCKNVVFANGTVCIGINKLSSTNCQLTTNTVSGIQPSNLSCGIILQQGNRYIENK